MNTGAVLVFIHFHIYAAVLHSIVVLLAYALDNRSIFVKINDETVFLATCSCL